MSNQSIQRASDILSLFSYARPQWRISDIAKAVKLPIGTAHGIVQALEVAGFLKKAPRSREYRLGIRLHVLGTIYEGTFELNQKASIPVSYLARETGLIGRLGVFHRDAVIVTMSTLPLESGSAAPYMGPSVPAFCSSMGRAVLAFMSDQEIDQHLKRVELIKYTPKTISERDLILAELAETRDRGYSVVHQELMMHLDSIGAPIFGIDGEVVGAISLNGDPKKISGEKFHTLAQRVMDTAGEISNYMGYHIEPQFLNGAYRP